MSLKQDSVTFTGTRTGMTSEQRKAVKLLLKTTHPLMVHHGGCHGADSEFDVLAHDLGIPIVVHPGDNNQRFKFTKKKNRIVCHVSPYLERNREMVNLSSVLIAAPKTRNEEPRGGTWFTIRYARKVFTPTIYTIYPDGTVGVG